jgi:hypothetical protein
MLDEKMERLRLTKCRTNVVTKQTTSTIVVTECLGCGGGTVTVTQPDVTKGTTTELFVTYTTVCPVTTTVAKNGETITKTYSSTSTITTHVATTIEEFVELPDFTKYEKEVDYTTYTSYSPVTDTKVIEGETRTITYSTLSTIIEHIPTTIVETSEAPDITKWVYFDQPHRRDC